MHEYFISVLTRTYFLAIPPQCPVRRMHCRRRKTITTFWKTKWEELISRGSVAVMEMDEIAERDEVGALPSLPGRAGVGMKASATEAHAMIAQAPLVSILTYWVYFRNRRDKMSLGSACFKSLTSCIRSHPCIPPRCACCSET